MSKPDYYAEAMRMADGARALILRGLAKGLRTKTKSDQSYVTNVDLETERYLRSTIERRFPDHGIIGEEYPPTKPGAAFQWIIDPIDGTLSFTRGIPLYGVIIALHREGKPLVGVIDHPGLGWRASAARGRGAWVNGKRYRIKDAGNVASEIIATGDRGHFVKAGRGPFFESLLREHSNVRTYADCFGHTLALRGSIGAMADFGVKIWDIGATELMMTEAGGKYVLLEKKGELHNIVFGKPSVVDWVCRLF